MTAQFYEILIMNGEVHSMATEPLESYLKQLKNQPRFIAPNTALWRGYICKWELKVNKLYLIELNAYTEENLKVDIQYLFPGQSIIQAYWFTGKIYVPQGVLLKYIHGGYSSIYEETLILNFNNGELIDSHTIKNEVKANDYDDDDLPF